MKRRPFDIHQSIWLALFLAPSLALVKLLTGWP
jgi:hypothetical protein